MTTIEPTTHYAEQFERRHWLDREPADWLSTLRKAGLARFAEMGFPSVQDEDWRYTNVAALAATDFALPEPCGVSISPGRIQPFRLGAGREVVLVFVNGAYADGLSDTAALPRNVRVMSLAAALKAELPAVKENFGRAAVVEQNAFVALNTALAEDGAFIEIPRGTVVGVPIHLLFVTAGNDRPTVAYPRNLIVAGEQSEVRLIEHYVGLDEGVYFNNVVTEVIAQDHAVIDHCKVHRESDKAYHIATVQMRQGRNSTVSFQSICLGGALVRNDINPVLDGEGAESHLDGLYLLSGKQHADHHLRVEHRGEHTNSREVFRGILTDHARGVFCGRIIVRPGAQKTDAKQTNMNLLLSPHALVDSKPQLEIFADDVKCTHGATIGQIDPDAIFYLRARGIGEEAARSLLTFAFARAGLAQVKNERLRAVLESLVLARLPQGELLQGAA